MSRPPYSQLPAVVMYLDFTDPLQLRAARRAVHHATTSSKTPGRINRGVTYTDAAALEVCPHCGRTRPVGPGVHAPRINSDASGFVDCAGRPVHRGAGGYYELAREAA